MLGRMDDALFSSEFEPPDTRHLWRLWWADVLDLGTAALLGWGALRALEWARTPGTMVGAWVGAWVLLSLVGGHSGWTLWRGVMGLRLVDEAGNEAGAGRGLGRALVVPMDLLISPVLQRRYFDRLLGVHPEAVALLSRKWQRGVGWQVLWLALLLGAVVYVVMPTRQEALTYLGKRLDGWRCCHRETPPEPYRCRATVARAVGAARGGDARAQAVVRDCPRAAAKLGR
jgi:hypothetical protein